jgi:hypothetical protein
LYDVAGQEVTLEQLYDRVHLTKAIRVDEEAFVLAWLQYDDGRRLILVIALAMGLGDWMVIGVRPDYAPIAPDDLPQNGSNYCGIIGSPTSVRGNGAIAVVCDPTITLLETLSVDGDVVDSDVPSGGAALLAVGDGAGAFAGLRNGRVVFASTLGGPTLDAANVPPTFTGSIDEAGLSSIRGLAHELLNGAPPTALGALILPGMEASAMALGLVLAEEGWQVTIRDPRSFRGGVVVQVSRDNMTASLGFTLVQAMGDWAIGGINLQVDPR